MGRKERERRKKEDQWGWGGMGYRCLKFHPSCHFLDIRLIMGKLFICRGLDFLTHEVLYREAMKEEWLILPPARSNHSRSRATNSLHHYRE